jgi:hypothetical protein
MLEPVGYTDVMSDWATTYDMGSYLISSLNYYSDTGSASYYYFAWRAFAKLDRYDLSGYGVAWNYTVGEGLGFRATNGWLSQPSPADWSWIQVDFRSSPKDISCVGLMQNASKNNYYHTYEFNVQYSDNGSNWTTVLPTSVFPQDWNYHWYTWTSQGTHRYWRINSSSTYASTSMSGWAIVRFFQADPEIGIFKLKGTFQNSNITGGMGGGSTYNMPNGCQLVSSKPTYGGPTHDFNMQYMFDDNNLVLNNESNAYFMSASVTTSEVNTFTFDFANTSFDILRYMVLYTTGRVGVKEYIEAWYSGDSVNWNLSGSCQTNAVAGENFTFNFNAYKKGIGRYVQLRIRRTAGTGGFTFNGILFYVQKCTERFLIQDKYDDKVYTPDGLTFLGVIPTLSESEYLTYGVADLSTTDYLFLKRLKKPTVLFYRR